MSNASDFIIENGVLKKYVGPGGDVVIPEGVRRIDCFAFKNCEILTVELPEFIYVGSGINLYEYGLFEECESLTEVRFGDAWRDHAPGIWRPSLVQYRKNTATDHTEARCNCIIHSDFFKELKLGDPNIYIWSELSPQDKVVMSSYYILAPQKFKEEQKKKCASYLKRYGKNVLKYAIEKGLDPGEIIDYCRLTDDELTKFLEQAVSCGNLAAKAALLSVANSHAVCDKADSKFDLDADSDPSLYWEYRIDKKNKRCIIKRYIGKESHVVMPSEIDGYAVKIIEKAAFYGIGSIMSVIVPEGVQEINNQAFMNCENLEHIKLPESLTAIGGYVFSHCRSLKVCTIPMGVTSIPNSAFEYCSNLKTVSFPAAERIGKEAFRGCSSLVRITVPKSVLRIEQEGFRECSNLCDVDFEIGIERIGLDAFENCVSLRSVNIPNSVSCVGGGAFRGCTGLVSVTISEGVAKVDDFAFQSCAALTDVRFADGNTNISSTAFKGCGNLVICAPEGSKAAQYAKVNNIPFVTE